MNKKLQFKDFLKSFLFLVFLGLGQLGFGQLTIAADGFNNSSSLFTLSGGTFFSGNSATGDRVASAPFTTEGSHAYGLSSTSTSVATATLTTTSNINTSAYTGVSLSLRLAAFSIGSSTNGVDATDIVNVEVSPNGGINYYSTLRVLGNGNSYWSYSTGTGIASAAYDGNTTPIDFQPSLIGGNRTTDGFSTMIISGLPATTTLRVRITLNNNATSERWLIDDFKITGTLAGCTPPSTQSAITFPTQTSSTIKVDFTGGNGAGRVVIANTTDNFTAPINGANPTANTNYGGGQQVIYNGTGNSIWVTNLNPTTTYYFRSYEYCDTERNYNTSATTYSHATPMSTNPLLSVSGSLSHGATCPGTAATSITYTITNNGINAAEGITVDSTNPTEFVVSGLSSPSIPGNGGTATYIVTFTPTSAGAKNATLYISSTTFGSNSVENLLSGTGTATVLAAVTTNAATLITAKTAALNGNVTNNGVCPQIIEKGFVYAVTSINATPSNAGTGVTKQAVAGISTGAYSFGLTNLASSTGYSYRSYVFDGATYVYGSVLTFTTSSALVLTGTLGHGSVCANASSSPITYTITNNGATTVNNLLVASSNGEFVVSGLSSTSISPSGTATYQVTFTPTTAGATTAIITVSSSDAASVTNSLTGTGTDAPPTITTPSSSTITYTSASLGGNITVQGCSSITERGIYYSTTSGFANGTGTKISTTGTYTTGTFTIPVTGLTSNTVYYYKAFATSASGTGYSSTQGTFTTPVIIAPVANPASSITDTSFQANWNAVAGATNYFLDVYQETGGAAVTKLSENFNGFSGGSTGGGAISTDRSSNLDSYTQTPGWTGSKVYDAGGTIKMGTGSVLGFITTPAIDLSGNGGAFTVDFQSMAWSGDATQLKLYLDGVLVYTASGLNNDATYTLSSFSVNLTGGTSSSKLKFEGATSSSGRFFLENFVITQGGTIESPVTGSPFTVASPSVTHNVTGLDSGTKYYYRVRATDGSSVSVNSNVIDVTTTGTVRWLSASATDWSTASNWSNGLVPDGTYDIEIPVGNPKLNTSYTVQTGKSLILSGSGTLTVAPSASLTVQGTADFGGKSVTLQSSVTGDAVIGQITGTLSNATNVTVERYMPAKRAWRALTAPLKGLGGSLFSTWQNGGVTVPNTGVEMWGPSGTNLAVGPNYSVLNYSPTGWVGVSDTSTSNLFESATNNAYLVFVTGSYGNGNINTGASATTLKATGELITGDVLYTNIISAKHSLIGNPYASPLDPSKVLDGAANLIPTFWVWDPSLANTGGYVAYDDLINTYSNNTGSYINNTIAVQSGQSFFVKANVAATGALTMSETVKSTSVSNVFGKNASQNLSNSVNASILRFGMFKESNQEWKPLDGAVAGFYPAASNLVDDADGKKFANGGENIAFVRNNITMSSEHFSSPQPSDELYLRIWNTSVNNYKLRINTESFNVSNIEATLIDLFTGAQLAIALDGTIQEYAFAVTSAAASSGNRFKIVFSASILNAPTIDGKEIRVFPNPATNGILNVQLPEGDYTNYSYEVVNVLGQKVLSNTIEVLSGNQFNFNTKGLASNWYTLRILNDGKAVYQTKVIIAN